MRKIILFSFILAVFIVSCRNAESPQTDQNLKKVKRIIDGDTFVIEDGTKKGEKIRLIGVDTPETRKSENKDVECYGDEATEYLKELLKDGYVLLEYDVNTYDRYGRTLAYVYLEDGTFVNAELVKNGYARVMTIPPNVKYSDLFVQLQIEARENNRGLWGEACD